MQDLTSKVRSALAVYLDRGRAALDALNRQMTEEFFEIMVRRDAAFHNFQALDALAAHHGLDMAQDAHLRRLWNDVDQVNRTLAGRMHDFRSDLGGRLTRLRAGRAQTAAYHSGAVPNLRLVKQV